ncbi:hypothetical protein TIFTF001_012624 [Ficus carica]|uniref:Bromo domain-containing protein n=1 Tax=Ficus carica TaxID=3494 RepID=A0AA88A0N3_FICCA|nr:hypothetical protein TIFTF001_012624 [Ficus carica]
MIAIKTVMPEKKLKIKFTSKRIEADSGIGSCNAGQQVSQGNDYSMAKTPVPGTNKRGPEWVIAGQSEKRQKIDRSVVVQCSTILKKLMSHEAGWVFNTPVNPVALNIPDYFSIISAPMDLGTVKSKLEKNLYFGIEEFASDVRLTFSNAMLYNPPANHVHQMAKKLNQIFEMRWKVVEDKYNGEGPKVEWAKSSSGKIKKVTQMAEKFDKTGSLGNRSEPRRPVPSKVKVVSRSFEASYAEEEEHFKTARKCILKLGKNVNKGTDSSGTQSCCPVNPKGSSSPTIRRCGLCGSIACACSLSNESAHVSSSAVDLFLPGLDMSSDRSLGRDDPACSEASRLGCQSKSMSTSQISNSDPDSDGAVSALDEENACPSSHLTRVTNAASGEGRRTPPLDVQLSPQKALRAAMLKCRFADTILKAQQKTLLNHADISDPEKLKQEKERLERRQREEKARIEAEIRAAEAASRLKAETELKQQREREREAARVALDKCSRPTQMERTIEIGHNLEVLKELEILCGFTPSSYQHLTRDKGREVLMVSSCPADMRSPLEQLGLFIKDEYLQDEDDNEEEAILNGDGEEGEIFDRD